MKKIDEKMMVSVLEEVYDKALGGIPKVSSSVDEFADDYLSKADSPQQAAKDLINYQIAKCATSGFVTGLGGLITLPVAIPANVGSVLYVQLRMVAAIAKIGGYDIRSDQVQTMAFACLTGSTIADVLKDAGIKFGQKGFQAVINKIPGKVLIAINRKVGFRLITKAGEKGVVNLIKLVPVAGGVVNGAIDASTTKIIAKNAYSLFIEGKVPSKKSIRVARKEKKADYEAIPVGTTHENSN